ncbi:inositol polyphosphate phosphatase [Moniliophthora roreri]|nr:inositol polyphosphate phosphatase [Moniliophthora roreri]
MNDHMHAAASDRLLVQIASYNTNLQAQRGLPQDLVDWLSPTLHVSTFLSRQPRAPDIVAVGFQELLPLHLGLSGFSKAVINDRDSHIRGQIEANAPNKETFSTIAKIVNAGVALLIYARDDGIGRKICDVQTTWTGTGPGYMGNKGAVGVRFRVPDQDGGVGETFTFVCAHLTAHEEKLPHRIADFHHIVGTLLFPPVPGSDTTKPSTMYATSHLFFVGDLNFRVSIPPSHPVLTSMKDDLSEAMGKEETRKVLKDFDQLLVERRKRTIFVGLREGDFWKFNCSYKYRLGKVDEYSTKRTPSWTDRILYTTYTDSPDDLETSSITNCCYTSIPSYTTSDHKPIVSLLLLPPRQSQNSTPPFPPLLQLPSTYQPKPDPNANVKRYTGRVLDRIVGIIWWFFAIIGAGSAVVGLFNFVVGMSAWTWWKSSSPSSSSSV